MSEKRIETALISVYHKVNLEEIIKKLDELKVKIISTGGTKEFIKSQGVDVTAVEDLTSYPSILGGRVKTLHPKIFGGILARSYNEDDKDQMKKYDIFAVTNRLVDAGIKKIRKPGSSMEFDQIRKYVVGDDRRKINWKATARRSDIMVNQYRDEKSQPVYLSRLYADEWFRNSATAACSKSTDRSCCEIPVRKFPA